MGLAALETLEETLAIRKAILARYIEQLAVVDGIEVVGANFKDRVHAAWLCTVLVDRRKDLEKKLRQSAIESGQVHFRNDRYSVFANFREDDLPNMTAMEERYLVLPLHTHMTVGDADRVCDVIKSGW